MKKRFKMIAGKVVQVTPQGKLKNPVGNHSYFGKYEPGKSGVPPKVATK